MEKLSYTIKELERAGGGCRSKIYDALKAKTLKAKKRGKSTVILRAEAERYLESLPDYDPGTASDFAPSKVPA